MFESEIRTIKVHTREINAIDVDSKYIYARFKNPSGIKIYDRRTLELYDQISIKDDPNNDFPGVRVDDKYLYYNTRKCAFVVDKKTLEIRNRLLQYYKSGKYQIIKISVFGNNVYVSRGDFLFKYDKSQFGKLSYDIIAKSPYMKTKIVWNSFISSHFQDSDYFYLTDDENNIGIYKDRNKIGEINCAGCIDVSYGINVDDNYVYVTIKKPSGQKFLQIFRKKLWEKVTILPLDTGTNWLFMTEEHIIVGNHDTMSIKVMEKSNWNEVSYFNRRPKIFWGRRVYDNELYLGYQDGTIEIINLNKDSLEKFKEKQQKEIIDILNQMRPEIPIPIVRIVEITKLEKAFVKKYIQDIVKMSPEIGEYLELEEVFIKKSKEMIELEKLMQKFEEWGSNEKKQI